MDSKNQFMNDLEGARAWMDEASVRRSLSETQDTESAESVDDVEGLVTQDREVIMLDEFNVPR